MVSKLSSAEVLHFLIIVSVVLIFARVLGEICRKFKQPVVVGEILAGIIIGPSLLGSALPNVFKDVFLSEPRAYGAFDGLANLGVILLMFVAGIEVDLKQIRRQGKQAASISIMGIAFPFALGFAAIWFFHDYIFPVASTDRLIPSLFFGTALSITALSVIVKVLIDLNIIKTKVGGLVITAAMVDDFLGWILFSIIIKLMDPTKSDGSTSSILIVLAFALFMVTLGRWIVNKLLWFAKKYVSGPGGLITISCCLCFLGAVFTEYLGIRGVFGAFLMGIAVGDSKHFSDSTQNVLQQFVVYIISPLFFASVGLRVNFVTNFDFTVVGIILGIACTAKIVGAGIGARASGLKKHESMAIAFGMNARGSQEIVLGVVALQAKIIDERIFVGLVVMTVVTILAAGPLMKHYLEKHEVEEDKAKSAGLDTPPTTNRIVKQNKIIKPIII
jgi:Kef-type K+ transport system membrane component KefB